MELTEEQKRTMAEWAAGGAGLSEIQAKLSEEFGMPMTYMDVRFLMIDLGLGVQDKEKTTRPADADLGMSTGTGASPVEPTAEEASPGGVSLELDRINKPGAVLSGAVKFSDGVTATWFIDQSGRLALQSEKEGYSPSPGDLQSFQEQLRSRLGGPAM